MDAKKDSSRIVASLNSQRRAGESGDCLALLLSALSPTVLSANPKINEQYILSILSPFFAGLYKPEPNCIVLICPSCREPWILDGSAYLKDLKDIVTLLHTACVTQRLSTTSVAQ